MSLAKNPEDRYQTSHEMANEFYRAVGMATQPEIMRESYSLKAEPTESPSTKPEALPVAYRRTESEPPPSTTPQPELELPAKSHLQPESGPSPKSTSPPEPRPGPKSSRSRIWIGVGLFSLVCLFVLVFGHPDSYPPELSSRNAPGL